MKKIMIAPAALLLCFFVSCNTKESTTTTNSDTEKMNAKSKAVYRAIETGDASGLDSVMADDVIDHEGPGDMKGKDAVKSFLAGISKHVKNPKFDIVAQAYNGEYHFTWVKLTGTALDSTMGWPANSAINSSWVDIVKVKDGKAVEHWGFMDADEAHAMAGAKSMDHTGAPKMEDKKADKGDTTKKSNY